MSKIRALALATAVAASGALAMVSASAAPIVGTINITGSNTIDYATDTITFQAGTAEVGSTVSGSFVAAGFNADDVAQMRNEGVPTNYASPNLALGSLLPCGVNCIYQAWSGPGMTGNLTTFQITQLPYSVMEIAGVSLTIVAQGIVTLTGFDPTPATFFFSSQGPSGLSSFSATTLAVPGPVVGAGLPGLVMLAGGVLAWMRRRKALAA